MGAILLLTLGAPGSGKSTSARRWQRGGSPARPRVRVNRDDLRAMLHGPQSALVGADGDRDAEDRVTTVQRAAVVALLVSGVDVVVDDTNIQHGVLAGWVELARQVGAEPMVWDHRSVPVDVCASRVNRRIAEGGRAVPVVVIWRLHGQAAHVVVPADVRLYREPILADLAGGLMVLRRTHTRTYNAVRFADPHKKCRTCGDWIDGALTAPGRLVLVPCEHESDYRDVCPSWGPVDGCTCAEHNTLHPDRPIEHDVRSPAPGDDRRY